MKNEQSILIPDELLNEYLRGRRERSVKKEKCRFLLSTKKIRPGTIVPRLVLRSGFIL